MNWIIAGMLVVAPGPLQYPLGLRPPYEIVKTEYYADGGTTSFVVVDARGQQLVGGFDGRMQTLDSGPSGEAIDSMSPRHLFLDDRHPSKPNARLLPLWGEEERAVIQVLTAALDAELSPSEQQKLLAIRSIQKIPAVRKQELWHLLGATVRRQRLLDAIDRGLLSTEDCIHGYFGSLVEPMAIRSIAFIESSRTFEITLEDSIGTGLVFTLPVDSPGAERRTSSMQAAKETTTVYQTDKGPREHRFRFISICSSGSMGDRCILTVLLLEVPAASPGVPGAEWREGLLEAVRERVQWTLETDAMR